jgi:hypothetical protein
MNYLWVKSPYTKNKGTGKVPAVNVGKERCIKINSYQPIMTDTYMRACTHTYRELMCYN